MGSPELLRRTRARRHALVRMYVPLTGLVLLAFAGYVKGAPILQVLPDLTLIGALIVAVAAGHRLVQDHQWTLKGIGLVGLLLLSFLLGVVPISGWTAYSAVKTPQIFTIVPLCIVGGMVLLRDRHARDVWLRLNVALGLVVAGLAMAFPAQEILDTGRLSLDGGNTISVGRAIGAAALVLVVLALGGRHRVLSMVAGIALAGFLVWTGSRGPVLAAIVTLVVVAVVSRYHRAVLRIATAVAAVAAAALVAVKSGFVTDRLLSFEDASADTRRALWSETAGVIAEHPFGVGWGGLGDHLPAWAQLSRGHQYPHNLLLEVLAESGWPAGIMLVVVLAVALRRQVHATSTSTDMAMLALLVFYLLNAMVSSDVAGNRGLWVAVGAALVASLHRPTDEHAVVTAEHADMARSSLPGAARGPSLKGAEPHARRSRT